MGNHNAPHGHTPHLNDMGFDMAFIEAEHYARDASYQVMSPAQRPLDGTTNVEMYASKDVPVLAYPTLYCLIHDTEHPCAWQHKIVTDMGVCAIEYVKDAHKYVDADRVTITAQQTYTGRLERA